MRKEAVKLQHLMKMKMRMILKANMSWFVDQEELERCTN